MKNRIGEACFLFFGLLLFACGLAAIIFLGMILMPLVLFLVFVLAIKEIVRRRSSGHRVRKISLQRNENNRTAMLRSMFPSHTGKKIA